MSLTTSNIRNCSIPSSKLKALDVLLALASTITDEAKLDRIAPYIIDLLHDDAAIVRATAFKTLMQIVSERHLVDTMLIVFVAEDGFSCNTIQRFNLS